MNEFNYMKLHVQKKNTEEKYFASARESGWMTIRLRVC